MVEEDFDALSGVAVEISFVDGMLVVKSFTLVQRIVFTSRVRSDGRKI